MLSFVTMKYWEWKVVLILFKIFYASFHSLRKIRFSLFSLLANYFFSCFYIFIMNIQPIPNNTNFKSTYPVVHWVAETNGSYAPISNLKLTKKLQGKIIRILNKKLDDTQKPMELAEQKLRAYIGGCDIDYRNAPVVRSFYNRTSASPNNVSPVAYIISGKQVGIFNEYLTKNIGREKYNAKQLLNNPYSAQTIQAIERYNKEGLKFVKSFNNLIKDENNIVYALHTKFEIIRNKFGKIKDYRFVDARFLPVKNQFKYK